MKIKDVEFKKNEDIIKKTKTLINKRYDGTTGYSPVQKSDSIIRYSSVHDCDSFFIKLAKSIKFFIQKFEN